MTIELKKIHKWYITHHKLSWEELSDRDEWCRQTFGSYRHLNNHLNSGWCLQSEEEYSLFVLRWGINKE